MSSPLIPSISFLALPLNPLPFAPLCTVGHILLTVLPTSIPNALMETPQSSGLPLEGILLTLIPWNTRPSVESTFALPTSLMAVTDWLSSYLAILSSSPWISYRSLDTCFMCVSAIISSRGSYCSLLFHLCFSLPLIGSPLFPISTRQCLLLYIRPSCWAVKALSLT